MANQEHIEILKQGVEVWNEWRENNSGERPNLFKANFSYDYFEFANFGFAHLNSTDFSYADLCGVVFFRADFWRGFSQRQSRSPEILSTPCRQEILSKITAEISTPEGM